MYQQFLFHFFLLRFTYIHFLSPAPGTSPFPQTPGNLSRRFPNHFCFKNDWCPFSIGSKGRYPPLALCLPSLPSLGIRIGECGLPNRRTNSGETGPAAARG